MSCLKRKSLFGIIPNGNKTIKNVLWMISKYCIIKYINRKLSRRLIVEYEEYIKLGLNGKTSQKLILCGNV